MVKGSQGPARGYTWPPFEPDHTVSVRHGALSERFLAPVVGELLAGLGETAPWTSAAAFGPATEAWAWSEARCVLYRRYFDEHGVWDASGEMPRSGMAEWNAAEGRAAAMRAELGLSPRTLVAILARLAEREPAAMAGALDTMMAAGREIRQAAERRQIAAAPEDGDGDGG